MQRRLMVALVDLPEQVDGDSQDQNHMCSSPPQSACSGQINSLHGDSVHPLWVGMTFWFTGRYQKVIPSHTLKVNFQLSAEEGLKIKKYLEGSCLYTEEAQDPETVPFNQDTFCSAVF